MQKRKREKKFNLNVAPEIKEMALADLRPWDANPRAITEEAFSGLERSLEKFGYVNLIVVNREKHEIIAGHQRYKALLAKGVKSVPVILVDVDERTQVEMNIAMNNPQIAGHFTDAIVPLLERLKREAPEDYIELRLDALREELKAFEAEKEGKTLPDDLPEPPPEAITNPGDLWMLGEHRLLCADSTAAESWDRLMDGEKAKLLATDPPYLIDYTGAERPGGGGKDWSHVYHEIEIKDADAFYRGFMGSALAHVIPHAAVYLWHASKRVNLVQKTFEEHGILLHQQIIWVKPAPLAGYSLYSYRHEPCLLGWRKGNKPAYGGRGTDVTTVWKCPFVRSGDPVEERYQSDVWELDWDGKKRPQSVAIGHPTVKPTEVFAIPLRMHTRPGDLCVEPFSGSGTQIIAAERTGRRCYAMEIEPVFCDVAVRRWEAFTGEKAKRVTGGAKHTMRARKAA